MAGLFDIVQTAAYTGASAYMGYLVGSNQCPASAVGFYLSVYSPAAIDACAGAISGLRGNAYHGNLISRLFCEQPEGDSWELNSIPEGLKGAVVGAISGMSVSGLAHYAGIFAGDLARRLL